MSTVISPRRARPVRADHSNVVHALAKVPLVTAAFWFIKVLATTVGETAADFLNVNLGFGLAGTAIAMSAVLAGVLVWQFRADRCIPVRYWTSVVLLSIVGTLITDLLVDDLGVSLMACTMFFGAALAVTFGVWYAREGTLSIHSIFSPRREAWYWLAILFTFALGTAAGDLLAEGLGIGFGPSVLIFSAAIALVGLAYNQAGLNGVAAFWMAYILTRPLGASIGDYLSQSRDDGGRGLGTVVTSAIFLAAIGGLVAYLSATRTDELELTTA